MTVHQLHQIWMILTDSAMTSAGAHRAIRRTREQLALWQADQRVLIEIASHRLDRETGGLLGLTIRVGGEDALTALLVEVNGDGFHLVVN
jgi:hypothetical protein